MAGRPRQPQPETTQPVQQQPKPARKPTPLPTFTPTQPAQRQPQNVNRRREFDPRARMTGDKPFQTPQVYQKPVGYDQRAYYWQEPQRVARYYHAMQTLPPGTPLPPWMDTQRVSEAYSYLQKANGGRAWYNWEPLADNDPGNAMLAAIPLPPPEAMPDPERKQWYQQWNTDQPASTEDYYPMAFTEAQQVFGADALAMMPRQGDNVMVPTASMNHLTGLPGNQAQQQLQTQQAQTPTGPHGIPQEAWDALPWWQQVAVEASPWVGRVIGAASMGIMGLSMGGPAGAAAGIVGGWAMGAQMENGIDPETGKPKEGPEGDLARIMMALDYPADQLERGLGVVGQFADNPGAVLADPNAAWEAGAVLYEAGALGSVALAEDEDAKRRGVIKYETWNLGEAEARVQEIPEGSVEGYFMAQARQRIQKGIAAGRSPSEIVDEIKAEFGLTGQIRDTVGHMFLDPLNAIGDVGNAGLAGVGKVAKNVPLTEASLARSQIGTGVVNFKRGLQGQELLKAGNMFANDTSDVVRLYGQSLRMLPPEEAQRYGAVSRWIAGLDEAGQVKKFNIGRDGKEKAGLFDYMRGDTPQARATEVLTHSVEGLQQMINDEPDIARVTAKVQAIAGASPQEVVTALDDSPLPKWFESAEAQPVPLALRDMRGKVNDLYDRWRTTRDQASILQRVADMMGTDVYDLMAKLHKGKPEDADALYRAFVQKLQKAAAGDPAIGLAPDKQAKLVLDSLVKDQGMNGLDGKRLKDMAGTFLGKDSAPFAADQYKSSSYPTV